MKIMNQKSFDLRMQELKFQYVKELNEIERQKDAIKRKKIEQLNSAETVFYNYKRVAMNEINDITARRAMMDKDDTQREQLSAEISRLKSIIDARRSELTVEQNNIIENAYNQELELNYKHRKLRERSESERLSAMRQLAASREEVSNEKDNV